MVKTLVIYILNPTLFIYYFTVGSDFMSGDDRNWIYFIITIKSRILPSLNCFLPKKIIIIIL